MLYTEQNVRDNIRNRDGKRVFFLGSRDQMTSGARDYLRRERIEIRPAQEARISVYRLPNGATVTEKPEHMTHLNGDILVMKTHPRIAFRGKIDALEAEIILCQLKVPGMQAQLGQILALTRMLIRCDVLNEPVGEEKLCGLTAQQIREHSHRPQDYYGQPHFMPEAADGEAVAHLNRCRSMAREAELAAVGAFVDGEGVMTREDILRAMNRISSMLYILMIKQKAGK